MISNKVVLFCLFVTMILATLLRFVGLGTNPPSLNSDEVAIGYNAYSILKTGRDEYGKFLPLAFRSFDDYKPPLYIYLTVPSVAVFGLNEVGVRFPSAILGVLAVFVTFLLTKNIFSTSKNSLLLGLVAAGLLAISPWHLQFTRTAYETGSLAFFTSLGLLFLIKSRQSPRLIIFSAIVFALETYLYQAAKIFVPLIFLISAFIVYFPKYLSVVKRLSVYVFIFSLLFLPNVLLSLSSEGSIRFRGTSIFQDNKPADRLVNFKITDWLRNDNKSATIFHPTPLAYFQSFLTGYLSHFRPDFLVANNANPKIAFVPEVGLMYLWELPFLLLGLHFLLTLKFKKPALLLIGWVLIAPLAAGVTTGVPSPVRSAAILPAIQIITALGLIQTFRVAKTNFPKIFLPSLLALAFLITVLLVHYLHMLFVHAPIAYSQNWYFSYKEAVAQSNKISANYDRVIVSTRLDEPQIFYLFYLRYDPEHYQKIDGGTVSGGFAEDRNRFGKYLFKTIDWPKMKSLKNTLFVGLATDFPSEARITRKFSYLDGTPSIYFAESDNL